MQRFMRLFTPMLIGALVCASVVVTAGTTQVSAQDGDLGAFGLPEINVTISNTAFEGIPEELEAGRYLLTVMVEEDVEFGGGVTFVEPKGMTTGEFLEAVAGPPDIAGADASPELEGEGGKGEAEDMGAPPEFLYQFTWAGGTYAEAGQTAQVILELTPGEWVAWGDDPEAPQPPVEVTVTGEMPADLVEPESDATITMAEYSIEVTEGELTAGQQVVQVTNVGAQPHFIFIALGPESMIDADIEAILESEMTGTPPATDLDPDEDFTPVAGTGSQSMGTDIWISVDLEVGKYLMICFFPDIESGMPHAMEGMYNIIEVTE